MRQAVHLRVVRVEEPEAGEERPAEERTAPGRRVADMGDLMLVAVLFLLNLVPVIGELIGVGRWSSTIVGFAAGATLLTGRELWSQLRARVRANT
jgi:hypothetical protein